MAEQHRATADEWSCIKEYNSEISFSCILELLHRIEALEAPQSGSIDLSHLSDDEREKILKLLANPDRFEVLEVAQPAKPNHPENPDSSLVDRVVDRVAISLAQPGIRTWDEMAVDVIREVAAWLREQKVYGVGWVWAVERLEEEAKR